MARGSRVRGGAFRLGGPRLPRRLVGAAGWGGRGISVLGRLTARIHSAPQAGDECVVIGWPLGAPDGRKLQAGTALFRDDTLLAIGRAVWFTVDDTVRDPKR